MRPTNWDHKESADYSRRYTVDDYEEGEGTPRHCSILLSEAEMAELDDGQERYQPGDVVYLGGYSDGLLDLCVNGVTHDNWTSWEDLPDHIRQRLAASPIKA